jgi:hypothetical protein
VTFLPLAFRLALRLAQIPVDEALSSPGLLTSCIRDLARLLSSRLVVNHFDLALLAQAGGCSVERSLDGYRIASTPADPLDALGALAKKGALRDAPCVSTILESTSRLSAELKGKVEVVGVAPGPISLAAQMLGGDREQRGEVLERAAEVLVRLATEYCERGAAMILVAEEVAKPSAETIGASGEYLRPVWNVARYYSRPSLYLIRGDPDQEGVLAALKIGADRVGLPLLGSGGAPSGRRCLTLPLSLLSAPAEEARASVIRLLSSFSGGGPVLTEWEIPAETDVRALQALMAAIGAEEA